MGFITNQLNMRVLAMGLVSVLLALICVHSVAKAQSSWSMVSLAEGVPVTALLSASDGFIYAGTANGTTFRFNDQVREDLGSMSSGANVQTIVDAGEGVLLAVANGVYRTTNSGLSWTQVEGIGALSLVANLQGEVMAVASGVRAFRSLNRGESWIEVSSGLPISASAYVATNRSGTIVVGTSAGLYSYDDFEEKWKIEGLNSDVLGPTLIGDDGSMYAVTNTGVKISDDSGKSWKQVIDMDAGQEFIPALALDSLQGVVVSVGSLTNPEKSQVLRSTDRGGSWLPLQDGLDDRMLFAITAGPSGHLYSSAADGKVYELQLGTTGVREQNAHAFGMDLGATVVRQGRELEISVVLVEKQQLNISIVNAKGLVEPFPPISGSAGENHFTIPTDQMNSGTYWICLTTENAESCQRIVVLR